MSADAPTDPRMAILTNRLPFMDLGNLCQEQGFTYACVWRPWVGRSGGTELQLDERASYGEFATKSKEYTFASGEGVPGRAYAEKDVAFCADLSGKDARDQRSAAAKGFEVKGCFAIWRDGAVWEFGGPQPMPDSPKELISTFGGTTGVRKAANAVLAIGRMNAAVKEKQAAA